MISWALDLADMIWFGLAERAPLKNVRMKLMVGEVGSGDVVEQDGLYEEGYGGTRVHCRLR
jgi:hypothetical protein